MASVPSGPQQDPFDSGVPGASARREHDRRSEQRNNRVRGRYPRLGGLILALSESPQVERRWARGSQGEVLVAEALAERCREEVCFLHDRRMPRSRANLDHIAVGPSGVWVIDTKRYAGKLKVARPLMGEPRLIIGGRDRTNLIDGLAKQVAAVREAVDPEVPVLGALCFVDTQLPWLNETLCGFRLLGRRGMAKQLNREGPLSAAAIDRLALELAQAFPPA